MPEVVVYFWFVAGIFYPWLLVGPIYVLGLILIVGIPLCHVRDFLKRKDREWQEQVAADPDYAAYLRKQAWREAARCRVIDRRLAARGMR